MSAATAVDPRVWRAYDLLARAEDVPGASYSPACLLIARWLAFRPGSTAQLMTRVHAERPREHLARLHRMQRLGLVRSSGDGRLWPQRWWLTDAGRVFVALVDEEGVT